MGEAGEWRHLVKHRHYTYVEAAFLHKALATSTRGGGGGVQSRNKEGVGSAANCHVR